MAFGGYLQANTAVDLMVGPFVDETNGKDAETGLTITQAEVRLSKNGANIAQKNEATSLTHDELGNYVCKLDTTDTNTEGILTLMVHESGALPIKMDYMVLAQAAYISHVTAKDTGFMDINVKAVSEDTVAADNLESACDNYSVTRGLTGTALPAVAADGVGGVPISDAGGLDLDTKLANTNEITVARMGALTDWINGGRLDLLLDAIPTTAMRGTDSAATEAKQDIIDTNIDQIETAVITNAAGVDIAADIIAVKAETATIVTDTNELQTDWADGGRLDLLLDAIKVVTDNQSAASTTLITGTVSWDNTNATTTVIYSDDITEATADHYNGRLFVPTSGALLGQYTDITDYALDTGEGKFTVTALTEAPADNTTFVII